MACGISVLTSRDWFAIHKYYKHYRLPIYATRRDQDLQTWDRRSIVGADRGPSLEKDPADMSARQRTDTVGTVHLWRVLADEAGLTAAALGAAELPQARADTEAESPATPATLTAIRETEEYDHTEDQKTETGT